MSSRTTTHPRQTMNAVKFGRLRSGSLASRTFSTQSDIPVPVLPLPAPTRFWYHYVVINTKADRAVVSTFGGRRRKVKRPRVGGARLRHGRGACTRRLAFAGIF